MLICIKKKGKNYSQMTTMCSFSTLMSYAGSKMFLINLFFSPSLCSVGVHESQHEKVLSVTGDGIIQSPDFPNTYPRNTVIVWRLVAVTESSRVQLTFDPRFGLEDAEDGICK